MFRVRVAAAAALLLLCALGTRSDAHVVEPLIIDLQPRGRDASTTIRVTNSDPVPLAVEVYAERRLIDENGVETRERVNDFLFSPPQLRVEAGQTGVVRIRYIGDPALIQSAGYAITVAQLPLTNVDRTGVQVLINFAASVHVIPKGAKSAMKATAATVADGGGKHEVRFQLLNEGNRHQGMAAGKITLVLADGRTSVIEGDALKTALRHTLIPAGGKRNVAIPAPADWPAGSAVSVKLQVPAPAV